MVGAFPPFHIPGVRVNPPRRCRSKFAFLRKVARVELPAARGPGIRTDINSRAIPPNVIRDLSVVVAVRKMLQSRGDFMVVMVGVEMLIIVIVVINGTWRGQRRS